MRQPAACGLQLGNEVGKPAACGLQLGNGVGKPAACGLQLGNGVGKPATCGLQLGNGAGKPAARPNACLLWAEAGLSLCLHNKCPGRCGPGRLLIYLDVSL